MSLKKTFSICALGAALMLIAPVGVAQSFDRALDRAENPAPGAFFNPGAKRVKPPKPGERRITVQIDPEEQAASLVKPEPEKPSTEAGTAQDSDLPGRFDWFWEGVRPERLASGPGRLDQALQLLAAKGQVPAPRLQHLQEIARHYAVSILTQTVGTQVSPALVLALISVESGGQSDAVSSAGAGGLMQLMPATAERFGVTDRMEAGQNIAGGVKYLDWLMQEFDRDPILVLAGYNAGEGAIATHDGVPPYAETRDYVPKVLAAFQVAKGLCKTPPELISDGCVFVSMQ